MTVQVTEINLEWEEIWGDFAEVSKRVEAYDTAYPSCEYQSRESMDAAAENDD